VTYPTDTRLVLPRARKLERARLERTQNPDGVHPA
jgi:hypothetical protein